MTSRSSDPKTSKDAGQLATTPAKLRASHALILRVFELYGAMHDKDLIDRVHAAEKNFGIKKLMSPSGVRSRRSEMSKPNMERLDEIAMDINPELQRAYGAFESLSPEDRVTARMRLVAEGFRSKLWDTGRREVVDGRHVIVWGLAK